MDCQARNDCEPRERRIAHSNTLAAALLTALAHAVALVLLITFSLA